MVVRVAFRSAARAGAVQLLEDFKVDLDVKLQIYRARPRTLLPPTAFIDQISETLTDYVGTIRQRSPTVDVIVVHGLYDSGEAVDQGDAFVDGFLDWIADRYHAFGANTLVSVSGTSDLPGYVPDWLPPSEQKTYYATLLRLEGFAAT